MELQGKLDMIKTRGLAKIHDVQHNLSDRGVMVKRNLVAKQSQVQSSMASNPMKWAGIAAGSGFAIGMLGRFVHWRNKRRPALDIVVIDAMC